MLNLLLIWLAVCIGMMSLGSKRYSAGMPLAYFLGLSLIHVPGAMVYLDAVGWDPMAIRTRVGFEQTVVGMVAFLIGVVVARQTAFAWRSGLQPCIAPAPKDLAAWDRLALFYISGGLSWFVLNAFGGIATLSAVIASLSLLLMAGPCLRLWVARESRNRRKFWFTIALLPLLPLITMLNNGFVGFGTYWVLAIGSFVFAQSKRRLVLVMFAPAVLFVGISLWVNYMGAREDIRKLVWVQQADVGDRVERFVRIFDTFEWLDTKNSKHRAMIDGRLNQNPIVGLAVERLEGEWVAYAHGATILDMFVALIPRALWPEKPVVGGGAGVVQKFTGMQYAEGTSVGAGQVLEFYVNFGTFGVIGGFLLYGWLIGRMDLRIIECLNRGDQRGFLLWSLLCLSMLQPGGNLLEVVTTAGSSVIVAYSFSLLFRRVLPGRSSADDASPRSTLPFTRVMQLPRR
jgi:energy-coupling factor transporter transmembrane protein EcfT